MKLRIIFTLALATIAGCSSSSSPTSSTPTPQTNVPPGWSDSLNFGHYIIPGDFATFGTDLFIFTGQGIFYSTDDGITVTERDAGIYFNTSSGTFMTKDNFLFAYVPGTGLMRSPDLGKTWAQIGKTVLPFAPFVYGNAIYSLSSATAATPVIRSNDDGDTWTSISAGLPTTGVSGCLLAIGGKLYFETFLNYPYYPVWYSSSDQGTTWKAYTGPAIAALARGSNQSAYACMAVTANGTTLVGRKTFYVPDTVAIYGAPSGSDNFTPYVKGLEKNIGGIFSIVVSGNNVFAAGRQIYHSTDNGSTWTDITPTNPVNVSYSLVGIADGVLFAGGTGGYSSGVLVRRPLSDFK